MAGLGYGHQAGPTGGMHHSPTPPSDADCFMSDAIEEEHAAQSGTVSLPWHCDQGHMLVFDILFTIKQNEKHVPEPQSIDRCNDVQMDVNS